MMNTLFYLAVIFYYWNFFSYKNFNLVGIEFVNIVVLGILAIIQKIERNKL